MCHSIKFQAKTQAKLLSIELGPRPRGSRRLPSRSRGSGPPRPWSASSAGPNTLRRKRRMKQTLEWPFRLGQTSRWHQNKKVVVLQPLFRRQPNLGNKLNGHPVQHYVSFCATCLAQRCLRFMVVAAHFLVTVTASGVTLETCRTKDLLPLLLKDG